MDLYEPLYIPRPTVEPELFASLRPPVYSGALQRTGKAQRDYRQAPQRDAGRHGEEMADSDEEPEAKKAEPKAGEAKEAMQASRG